MASDPPWIKWIRRLMVVTVLAVAIFAAIQSYTHNYDLALAHHERGAALRLLPLSVDWLMLAAGLVLLIESHRGLKPKLPKFVLWVGIIATGLGNVAALWIYGPVATIIGAWGPVCLVLTIEMGMYLVRSLSSAKPEVKPELSPEQLALLTGQKTINELRAERAPEAVASPGDPIQGWGQLGRQEPAGQGLQGIGLRNGRE